jgi:hypothetical protein
MRALFDESRKWRINYVNERMRGRQEFGIDAAACAIREDAIVQCMIAAGMPREEGMRLLEYHPDRLPTRS